MMIRVGDNFFDPEKISAILTNTEDASKIVVVLDNGRGVVLDRDEAVALWIYFDKDGDWRREDA